MTNYDTGHVAEKRAAAFLKNRGFKIRQLNWKTRWCEIDIVAEKDSVIYFVEVKYRRNTKQGRGLDYITPGKLRQMSFAAEFWAANNAWTGEYQLAGLGIDGENFDFVEIT